MKLNHYKVSVIVPVYNVQEYLEKCLLSIINQDFESFEIIIINDGSTDNSSEILAKHIFRKENVKIFHQENSGLSSARNLGLKNAKGEYIYFVDSDDYIAPKALKILYEAAIKNNLEIINYNAIYFGDNYSGKIREDERIIKSGFNNLGIVDGFSFYRHGLKKKFYNPGVQYYFYKSEFLKEIGLGFEDRILYEDELFTPQVLYYARRVMWLNECLYYYRHRNNSIIRSELSINHLRSAFIVANNLYNFFSERDQLDDIIKKELFYKYLKIFKILYKNKSIRNSFRDQLEIDLVIYRMRLLGLTLKENFYTSLINVSPSIYYGYIDFRNNIIKYLNTIKFHKHIHFN